jgi:hypothetical protein
MEPITGDVETFHHGLADLDALFAGRLARYANIDILKTSSAEEENSLGNVALSWECSALPPPKPGSRPYHPSRIVEIDG